MTRFLNVVLLLWQPIPIFALISLILFVVAVVANAFVKNGKFDVAEIRKLLFNNMIFMLVFALLDYFLV